MLNKLIVLDYVIQLGGGGELLRDEVSAPMLISFFCKHRETKLSI